MEKVQRKKWVPHRDIPHEFFIIMGSEILNTDFELFFQESREFDSNIQLKYVYHSDKVLTMEDLCVLLDFQPSKSQARSNGWSGLIPEGYSEFKKKCNYDGWFAWHKFYILNLPNGINVGE